MLAPEVWNFPFTKNNISLEANRSTKNPNLPLEKLTSKHPYNETISIVIPEEDKIPDEIANIIDSSFYYVVKDFQLLDLTRKEFIEAFIKRGKLTALNIVEFGEIDDIFAITPDGLLILTINKDLYQSLGIDGRPHHCHIRKRERFVIEINLRTIQYDKKPFARLKFALSNKLFKNMKIDMRIIWEPADDTICRSSLGKYFHDLGREIEQFQPKAEVNSHRNAILPKFSFEQYLEDKSNIRVYEFIEALNLYIMSCNKLMNVKKLLSTYDDEEFETFSNLKILNCKGYFESDLIMKLINTLRKILNSNNNIPWITMNVNGFQESPISFYNKDHNFYYNGDNDFLLILFRNETHLLFKNVSSNTIKK